MHSRSILMEPPILSMQGGCVAAWSAGGLPGPSLSGALLRDVIRNTYHARLGTDSGADAGDPLFLAPEMGKWYVYFPGSAGNSATVTLANSTTYDYTITYSDGTTDTDEQTSTGAGLMTFGGTDAKFAGLKVRRILIVPDGGGATVADIDFSQQALWNAARTSITAVTGGQTVTINRSSAGPKTCVADRPLYLYGTDDSDIVASNDAFNPGLASFTAVVALRKYGNTTAQTNIFGKKAGNAASNAGWYIGQPNNTTILARVSDGTNQISPIVAAVSHDGLALAAVLAVDRRRQVANLSLVTGKVLVESADQSITSVGAITNSEALTTGTFSNQSTGPWSGEIFGRAYFSRVLATDETLRLARELLREGS